jgi:hypothetical protein
VAVGPSYRLIIEDLLQGTSGVIGGLACPLEEPFSAVPWIGFLARKDTCDEHLGGTL